VAYFVNSGSEANDMALLMARLYSGNYDVLALRNCYHGMSEGTMGVTAHATWKFNVPQVCFFHVTLSGVQSRFLALHDAVCIHMSFAVSWCRHYVHH